MKNLIIITICMFVCFISISCDSCQDLKCDQKSSEPKDIMHEDIEVQETKIIFKDNEVDKYIGFLPKNEIEKAIKLLCDYENVTEDYVFNRTAISKEELVDLIEKISHEYFIDPLLLLTITWRESKFDTNASHDQGKGCGMTGVRSDIPGRPECEWLNVPENSLRWTANFLKKSYDKNNGIIRLREYNGGKYEIKIWRVLDYLQRGLKFYKEEEEKENEA